MIKVRRVYEPEETGEGARFLVDRMWPRGQKKEALHLAGWLREVAPSTALRQWFGHDPAKWEEFQRRYTRELEGHPETWQPLLAAAQDGPLTLLFGARDTEHNNAQVLKAFLEKHLGPSKAGKAPRQVQPRKKPARVT